MPYCDLSGPIIQVNNVESDIADHCNLSCAGCNHGAPFFRPGFYNLHDFKKDITALAPVLHVKSWYLLGGEPLLNPRVLDYAKFLRASGVCDNIDLWTNGLLLPKVGEIELFGMLNRLVISKYPGVNYAPLDAWLAATELPCKVQILNYGSFKPSILNTQQSEQEAREVFDTCMPRRACHQVCRGTYYLCPESLRLPVLVGRPDMKDGCNLHEENLGERLRDHLAEKREPLASCRFCRAYSCETQPHRQIVVPPTCKVGF